MSVLFQAQSLLKNVTSNGSKGRDSSSSKQNLSALSPGHIKEGNKNVPDNMDLIIKFLRLRALINEMHHSLQFLLTPSLESRRVVEDELWVALEGEFMTDIVVPPLQFRNQSSGLSRCKYHPAGTFEVGWSWVEKG